MSFVKVLRCVSCKKEFDPKKIAYSCDRCGERLDVIYDYEAMKTAISKDQFSHRPSCSTLRYRECLPIFDHGKVVSLGEGGTPLIKCDRLGRQLGLDNVYAKDESRNPTGVFKDRATVLAVTKALEFERKKVAIASTGNAAASLAAYAAKAALDCNVLVPESTPMAKVSQAVAYGGKIVRVKGNYDQTYDLAVEACETFEWYNCNPAWNPFRTEGKKTIAYEICEQSEWKAPDWVVVPVGNGCNLAGIWKGFKEFYELGFIREKPRILGIQPSGSNPVVTAFKEKKDHFEPMTPRTLAGALAIGKPRNFVKAIKSLNESNGSADCVSDDEILEAQSLLARKEGIFAEPGAAAAVAGLVKAVTAGLIHPHERICCVITGNGLKDPEAPLKLARTPVVIEPNIESIRENALNG
ncbi:MAG TPA: threonine synthase [Candidatus Acidoferrales bacterium]|nr:threonine synthase [Candidatus Acidoferrales bacterium]